MPNSSVVGRLLVALWLVGILVPCAKVSASGPACPYELADYRISSMQAPEGKPAQAPLAVHALLSSPTVRRDTQGRVLVEMVVDPAHQGAAREMALRLGGTVTKGWPNGERLQGWLPEAALGQVTLHDAVYAVRQPHTIVYDEQTEPMMQVGAFTTEGVAAMNAQAWHDAGYTGDDVRVGIIDGGFKGQIALLGTELPATVTVRNFADGQDVDDVDNTSTSPHGAACAEVIHDIVPDADLYLAKIESPADLFQAVDWMIARDVHIISTSFGFFNESAGDGTGMLAEYVQTARDAGILWCTAAGNERTMHWGGAFVDADGDGKHEFTPGVEINYFGAPDGAPYTIGAGALVRVYARWDDWDSVTEDLALVMYRWDTVAEAWEEVRRANRPQRGAFGQEPIEAIEWITDVSGAYGYGLDRVAGERAVHIEVFTPKVAEHTIQTVERSLANLADAPAAVTVGALDAVDPWPQEWYSSQGPTNGPGGTAEGGIRKPDICGYANVSTASYGGTLFKGTSSATPHVAGAAALLLSASLGWSPDALQAELASRAVDLGVAGPDTVYGFGRVHVGWPGSEPTPEPTSQPTLAPQPTATGHWLFLPMVVQK